VSKEQLGSLTNAIALTNAQVEGGNLGYFVGGTTFRGI